MRAAQSLELTTVTVAAAAALLIATAAGCVREGAPPVAPVEANDTGDAGPTAAYVIAQAPPPPQREQCVARLRAAAIKTGAGCTLDERISHANGTLLYPCFGDGTVEAVFEEHRFVGTLSGATLALTLTTELDWDDGCHWETQQGIRGSFRRDGKPKLVWSYSESPVRGTGCFGSCTAKADIEFEEPEH